MTSCFSESNMVATPPVYVLSCIRNLSASMKKYAFKGVSIKPLILADEFYTNSNLKEDEIDFIKDAEIAVCDGLILARAHKYMKNLKWAHCTWAGIDPLLKSVSASPSFVVTRHAGSSFCSLMAEYVMCQILNHERSSRLCLENQKEKKWLMSENIQFYRGLKDLKVSILGVGNMGSAIAEFLKSRGTAVAGLSRTPRSGESNSFNRIFTDLDDVLSDCDYLCNTLPSTSLTCGLLNNGALQMCKKKPVFINVGRGNIINEEEILLALRNGWISGAVLDTFENEPLPSSSKLWFHPKVTITPHVAAISNPDHIAEEFFLNLKSYIDGKGLKNVVDWSAGY